VTAEGRDPLVVESWYSRGVFEHLPASTWMIGVALNAGTLQSRYWSIGDSGVTALGSSRLGAGCAAGMHDGGLVCTVYDGSRTRIVRIAADTGAVTGLGWMNARFISDGDVANGWLTGWVSSTAVAIDLASGDVLRLPRTEGAVSHMSVSGGRLAAVVCGPGPCSLRIYKIGDAGGQLAGRSPLTSSPSHPPAPQSHRASSAPHSARDGSRRR
jgi:hypothetical protein